MKSLKATFLLIPMLLIVGCGGDDEAGGDAAGDTETTSTTGTPPGDSASSAGTTQSNAAPTAEESVKALFAGIQKKNASAAWEALPASYQSDINSIVQTFATNMDPEVWNAIVPLVDKIAGLLQSKSDMLLNSEALQQSPAAMVMGPPQQQEAIREALPKIGDLLALVVSEAGDLEKLKSFDGASFMKNSGSKFLESVDAISQIAPQGAPGQVSGLSSLSEVQVTTVSSSGEKAVLTIAAQGNSENVTFVLVEGKWIPEDMARDWSSTTAEIKSGLAEMPQQMEAAKGMVKGIAPGIQNMLIPMENASTQEEFDQALNNMMAGMEGMAGMFGGGPGGPGGPPFGGPGGPGGPGGESPDDRPFLSPEEEAQRDGTPAPTTNP